MPGLKDLKDRIGSVKSTQKITKAMKMVAASKLRRAQENAEKSRPYSNTISDIVSALASKVIQREDAPVLLVGRGEVKSHLLVVISSDRGLCGGFNTSVVKEVKRKIAQLKTDNIDFKILCVGSKAYDQLKLVYPKQILDILTGIIKKEIDFAEAEKIADLAINGFNNADFDACTIFYSEFNSVISQVPTAKQIIPLSVKPNESLDEYEYEPSEKQIINELLPKNIAVQIYYGLLESAASEQGARMTAMDNATRNAGDMINSLSLKYNRTRQAVITKELIEIISGAEAV